MTKYFDINTPVKQRPLTWNEKLRKIGLPSWEQSLEVIKKVNN